MSVRFLWAGLPQFETAEFIQRRGEVQRWERAILAERERDSFFIDSPRGETKPLGDFSLLWCPSGAPEQGDNQHDDGDDGKLDQDGSIQTLQQILVRHVGGDVEYEQQGQASSPRAHLPVV